MYSKGQADPDNRRPDKWSSTVRFIVASSTKYFVAGQHRKGNPFLCLHGEIGRFYTIDSYL